MKKHLIIFGRSPFINKLKLDKIDYNKFDVCCVNFPVPNVKVNYIVSADYWTTPEVPEGCEWISPQTGWEFVKGSEIIQQEGKLSWKHFSSDAAVNFAILRGYKHIYLAGIDLVEDGKAWLHYNGYIDAHPTAAEGCRDEKLLIRQMGEKFGVMLYQLNPEAKWLKYADIGLL